MPIAFLDSNALLKLYLEERGASWLRAFTKTQQVAISELALFETATVVRRLYSLGRFSREEAVDLVARIRQDAVAYSIVRMGGRAQLDHLIATVFALPVNLMVRSLDSLHLSAAIQVQEGANQLDPPEPFVFVSSDAQLLRVAQAHGLPTDNPDHHPEEPPQN